MKKEVVYIDRVGFNARIQQPGFEPFTVPLHLMGEYIVEAMVNGYDIILNGVKYCKNKEVTKEVNSIEKP